MLHKRFENGPVFLSVFLSSTSIYNGRISFPGLYEPELWLISPNTQNNESSDSNLGFWCDHSSDLLMQESQIGRFWSQAIAAPFTLRICWWTKAEPNSRYLSVAV